jgi:hypothetical protein
MSRGWHLDNLAITGERFDLFGAEEGVAKEEEKAEDPDEGIDFAAAASAEFDALGGRKYSHDGEEETHGNLRREGPFWRHRSLYSPGDPPGILRL